MEPLGEEERKEKIEKCWDNFKNWQGAPEEDNQGEFRVEVEKLKALWAIQEELHHVGKVLGDIREQLFLAE